MKRLLNVNISTKVPIIYVVCNGIVRNKLLDGWKPDLGTSFLRISQYAFLVSL